MSDRVFLDTNIFVYAIDSSPSQSDKRDRARGLIREYLENESGVTSIQVFQEFFAASTSKIPSPLSIEEALEFIHYISAFETVIPNLDMVIASIGLHQRHGFSFWDAMIVQSAVVADCTLLLTEDFQHGFQLGPLTIKNPFV
jgi:predicted nucleic acid-binding protein